MPDHLHLILIGGENSNLITCLKIFKQITGYYFRQNYKKALWQKSFYERVIRKQESLKDTAYYVFNNPVRKGMVKDFRKYPFLGSFLIDVRELVP